MLIFLDLFVSWFWKFKSTGFSDAPSKHFELGEVILDILEN